METETGSWIIALTGAAAVALILITPFIFAA